MNDLQTGIQLYFFCIGPILLLPLVIGVIILRRSSEEDVFSHYAGWMTLKPLIATPIWWMMLLSSGPSTSSVADNIQLLAIFGMLPGAILTFCIVSRFNTVLFGSEARPRAWLLLVLDCVRWINSGFILAATSFDIQETLSDQINGFISITAILLPTIFALIAFGLSRDEAKKRKRKIKNDAYFYDV